MGRTLSIPDQILSQAPERPVKATCYRLEIPAAAAPGAPKGGRPILVPRRTDREPDGPDFWTLSPFQAPAGVPEGRFRIRWYSAEGVEVDPEDLSLLPAVTIRFADEPVAETPPPPPPPPPPPAPELPPRDPIDEVLLQRDIERTEQDQIERHSAIKEIIAYRRLITESAEREMATASRVSQVVQAHGTLVLRSLDTGVELLKRVDQAANRLTAPAPAAPPGTDWGAVINNTVTAAKETAIAILAGDPKAALAALGAQVGEEGAPPADEGEAPAPEDDPLTPAQRERLEKVMRDPKFHAYIRDGKEP